MADNQNQYENFKKGIKNDINNTATSLFLVGGLCLLGIILFAVLITAIKSDQFGGVGVRTLIGIGVLVIAGLLIFSGKARQWILGGWLILLVGIPVLFIFFLIFYMLYVNLIKNPL